VFQHGVDSLIAFMWDDIDYTCGAELQANGTCVFSGIEFSCDKAFNFTTETCVVSGPEVVGNFKGIKPDSTDSLLYLLALGLAMRAIIYIFYLYPFKAMIRYVRNALAGGTSRATRVLVTEHAHLQRVVSALQQDLAVMSLGEDASSSKGPAPSQSTRRRRSRGLPSDMSERHQRDLIFRDVSVYLSKGKTTKTILHNVDSQALAGRVCALMGACCSRVPALF
jgi:hypothetical protein